MRRIILDTYEDVCRAAADVYTEQLKEKPNSVLGLATGSTPIGLYDELVRRYDAGALDFSKARSFNLDEYYPIKKDHPQSYNYFMRKHLFDKINISKYSLPNGEAADAEAECLRYDVEISDAGGIDLMLLGIGHNGHIGFNEPAVSYPMGTTHVELAKSSVDANSRFFGLDETQPTEALTMGIGEIMRCKKIILLITGEGKAEIAMKLFERKIHTDIPACFLKLHPDTTVFLDRAAARDIIVFEEALKRERIKAVQEWTGLRG
ncbi:MAG: glucosamine-6-phosphate deaminase [Oscillospiraceae bacterium]|nr:glucosamine-6-phosphate deaminase [Oscillospiraceae bacterium]